MVELLRKVLQKDHRICDAYAAHLRQRLLRRALGRVLDEYAPLRARSRRRIWTTYAPHLSAPFFNPFLGS
jgi:hypothetical protein